MKIFFEEAKKKNFRKEQKITKSKTRKRRKYINRSENKIVE